MTLGPLGTAICFKLLHPLKKFLGQSEKPVAESRNRDVICRNRDVICRNRDVICRNRDVICRNRDVIYNQVFRLIRNFWESCLDLLAS